MLLAVLLLAGGCAAARPCPSDLAEEIAELQASGDAEAAQRLLAHARVMGMSCDHRGSRDSPSATSGPRR